MQLSRSNRALDSAIAFILADGSSSNVLLPRAGWSVTDMAFGTADAVLAFTVSGPLGISPLSWESQPANAFGLLLGAPNIGSASTCEFLRRNVVPEAAVV